MKDYNKENAKRLMVLFITALLIAIGCWCVFGGSLFSRIVCGCATLASAAIVFRKGYYLPEKEVKKKKEG